MKILHFENIPRWYALWWDKATQSLLIKIHHHFIKTTKHPDTSPLFKLFVSEETIDLFTSLETRLGKETFGFGNSIVQIQEDIEGISYQVKIPQLVFETGMSCPECGNTGEREFGGKCLHCDGTKREKVFNWENVEKVCSSLYVLFQTLEFPPESDTPTKKLQLFTVTAGSGCGSGRYLGGHLSPQFVELLKSKSRHGEQILLESVIEAEMIAHRLMFGRIRPYERHNFKSWISGGNLVIDCPGDACGLHPSPCVQDIRSGYGSELTCHNLDSSHQLLTLLCGWAATATMSMEV